MSSFERLEKSIEGTLERFVAAILGPDGATNRAEFVDRVVTDLATRAIPSPESLAFVNQHVVIGMHLSAQQKWATRAQTPEERVGLASEIRNGLEERGIQCARPLRIDVRVAGAAPSGQEQQLGVSYQIYERAPDPPRLVLRSRDGAVFQEFAVCKRLISIGRGAEVLDAAGRVVRRNTISLTNPSVSRIHARIEFDDEAAAYRMFDETTDGRTSLHRQAGIFSLRCGAWLRSGDEVQLGPMRFIVSFDPEEDSGPRSRIG